MVETATGGHGALDALRTRPHYSTKKITLAVSGAVVLHVLLFAASFIGIGSKSKEQKPEALTKTQVSAELVGEAAKEARPGEAAAKGEKNGAKAPRAATAQPSEKTESQEAKGQLAAEADREAPAETPPTKPPLTGLDDVLR